MSLTLNGSISSSDTVIVVSGTVTQAIGFKFRLDDELLRLTGFDYGSKVNSPWIPANTSRWLVARAQGQTIAASHNTGTSILGAVSAWQSSSDETLPSPFDLGPAGLARLTAYSDPVAGIASGVSQGAAMANTIEYVGSDIVVDESGAVEIATASNYGIALNADVTPDSGALVTVQCDLVVARPGLPTIDLQAKGPASTESEPVITLPPFYLPAGSVITASALATTDGGTWTLVYAELWVQRSYPGPSAPAQVATSLAFFVQPVDTDVDATITPSPTVLVLDQNGDRMLNDSTTSITVATTNLVGTATQTAVNGVATFAGLSVHVAALAKVLTATASGLTPATSDPFDVAVP